MVNYLKSIWWFGENGVYLWNKTEKTGISKTLKKFLLYYENECFWEHFEEKRSHISKLGATLRRPQQNDNSIWQRVYTD